MEIRVTHHAKRRFKQRVGLPARAVRKAAEEAYYHGTTLDELPSPIAEKLQRMADRHARGYRVKTVLHRGHPYCFIFDIQNGVHMAVLATVLPAYETPDDEAA